MKRGRSAVLLALVLGGVLLASLGCSGRARVGGDVGLHRTSGGSWGHSFSIGIQGHR